MGRIKWSDLIIGASSSLIAFRFLKSAFSDAEDSLTKIEASRNGTKCPGDGSIPCKLYPAGSIENRVKMIAGLIRKGSLDPQVRRFAVRSVSKKCDSDQWCTPAKDAMAELSTILGDFSDPSSELARHMRKMDGVLASVRNNMRYSSDSLASDQFQAAHRSLFDFHGGDCFPVGTLLLRDDYTFIPVEELRDGMKIWGRDRWSEVQRSWYKGILPVTVLTLNNGSEVKLTEDHHVFVAHCQRHTDRPNCSPCSCPVSEREIRRITVSELEEGMVVITPDRIPFGKGTMDVGRAYVEGLFISDGWCSHNADFAISGKDGHPKEEQKREVGAICERLGIATRWHERYITVKDKEWALRMQQMGHHAPEKHALSLDLDETAASALLRGIMADSGANTHGNGRTFTTTSRMLALQTRVLHKMFGVTCGYRYLENHGGLGKHPIYRLGVRSAAVDGKSEKLLRIKSIEREVVSVPCYDITTDDHYVYLPEHDVTVSQCDDFTIAEGAVFMALGYPVKARVYTLKGASEPGHIALRVNPDKKGRRYVTVDGSVSDVRVKGKKIPIYVGWDAAENSDLVSRYTDYAI